MRRTVYTRKRRRVVIQSNTTRGFTARNDSAIDERLLFGERLCKVPSCLTNQTRSKATFYENSFTDLNRYLAGETYSPTQPPPTKHKRKPYPRTHRHHSPTTPLPSTSKGPGEQWTAQRPSRSNRSVPPSRAPHHSSPLDFGSVKLTRARAQYITAYRIT